MAMGNGGVSVFGVALLVILFGCPYELGIGSGRGGFGGAMAQMNEEKEGGNGTVPPAGDDETEVDLEKMLEQKEVEIKKLTKLNEEIKEELRLKTEEASNLISTVNDLSTQTAMWTDLRNQVKTQSDEVQQLNTQVRSMKTILQSKSTEVDKLNRTVLDLNNQLQAKTDEAKKVTDQATQNTNILNADNAALKTANGKLQSELNDLNAKHTKAQKELSDANSTISTIQGQLQASNAKGTKCEDELRALKAAHQQIVLTNDQLQKDKDSLSAERSTLLTEKVECDKTKNLVTQLQATHDQNLQLIRQLQDDQQARNDAGALAQQKARRRKRSDTIAGVLLGLVFPLLALLGVLLYLYWQRRRRVFSSAAATSILVDQETELVNPDTAGNFVPTESGFQHPDSVHAGNQENDSYALDHVGNVTSSSGKARSSRRSYVGYEQDAI